jgi:uncharacterized protein (DUF2236 family)
MRLSETTFDNAPAPVQRTVGAMMREQPSVMAAHSAMLERGMTDQQCRDEITRVVRGCLWERERGMPLRFDAAFEALGKGRTAAELFPDELYLPEGRKQS